MNKDLLEQLPADEQSIAFKLDSVAEDMKLSPDFQWDLENQLMEVHKTKAQLAHSWQSKIVPVLGWAIMVIAAVFLLNWTIRSETAEPPLAGVVTAVPEIPFADNVRRGDICRDPLALSHGFNVFLTNEDKTGFIPVDTGNTLDEIRSFAWSPDGKQLAIVGNRTGSGIVHITDPIDGKIEYTLSGSEAGYVRDAAWSRDGNQLVLWSSQNLSTLYLLDASGHGLSEKELDVQILGRPQFAPDGNIMFYGADKTASGLFTVSLEPSQPFLLIPSMENEISWAFSPDGSLLAYMEYDRDEGEARLSTQRLTVGEHKLLGTLPIPRTSGASLPETGNLSWSPDGRFLVFDFGQFASQRAIYLARADGSGLMQIIEAGYAPAVSSDGRCLAYISGKQVFLLDLAETLSNSASTTPVLLADLPAGRTVADTRLDKLEWKP